jgi:hypothetical protein
MAIPGLRYLANERQMGAAESRNRGIAQSEGELVVFIDSDDRLHPEQLATVRSIFKARPSAGLVCCDCRIIGPAGEVLYGGESFQSRESRLKRFPLSTGTRSFTDIFVLSTTLPGTTFRRSVLDRIGGFDQALFPVEDIDLQLRASAAGIEVFYLNQPLADYRTHSGSVSAGPGRAVVTCAKKVECLTRWLERAPSGSRHTALRRRVADAKLELGIASWQSGGRVSAISAVLRSFLADPRPLLRFLQWRLTK